MCAEDFLLTPQAKTSAGKRENKRGRIGWRWWRRIGWRWWRFELPGKPVVLIKNSQTSMWLLSAARKKDGVVGCHRI